MTMRRLRPGIHWLVIHRESRTQRLVSVMRDGPAAPGRGATRSSSQARAWSGPLTRSRPTARHPAGTQASRSVRKPTSGKTSASRKPGPVTSRSSTGDPVLSERVMAVRHADEPSTGGAVITLPVRGTRPRTEPHATRAGNNAWERAGSTRQLAADTGGGGRVLERV